MSFLIAATALSAGVGAAKAIQGGMQARQAKEDAEVAKRELEKQKSMFETLDTSNPYIGMENVYEDLTVNQQEAQFVQQQQMQQQANIMQQMRGAAGSSGIAGLAQAMAQQSSMDAQRAAVSIGQQEQANQMRRQAEAGRIQDQIISGELMSREAQFGKVSALMGMAAGDLAGARARRQAGQEEMMAGIKDMGSTMIDFGVNTGRLDSGNIQYNYGSGNYGVGYEPIND